MRKRNIISLVAILIASFMLVSSVVFAWYLAADRMGDMKFSILQIDSLVTLYKANDSNYNGVPDKLESTKVNKYYNPESKTYITYGLPYYTEKYSYNYFDQKYALSEETHANLMNKLVIEEMVPSKIYGFKFEIINYSGLENFMHFEFLEQKNPNITVLDNFEARVGTISNSGQVIYVTDWTSFVTSGTYSGITLTSSGIKVDAVTTGLEVGRLDFWLQIRIKPEATYDSINKFELPYYKLTLECTTSD